MEGENSVKQNDVTLPDWLGSGQDLFGTIQIIKGKKIDNGFLEVDYDFKFSEQFNYPIVFRIISVNADIEACAIAFRIGGSSGSSHKSIEENIIAREVCSLLNRYDFIKFFADIVEQNIDFALYINKTPKKFQDMKMYKLNSAQKIVLNEKLVFEITDVLDRRKQ
jgi:hypothetical protein